MEAVYHSRVTLGMDAFSVPAWHGTMAVLASVSNPDFEGWRRELIGGRRRLLDAAGAPVTLFPRTLDFRVSVGTRTKLFGQPSYPLQTSLTENDFLLKLRFQMKIFRGLHQTVIAPRFVDLIGVPADLSCDERIYHISFDLPPVPMSDRLVLEILAPNGERLSKFSLDLM